MSQTANSESINAFTNVRVSNQGPVGVGIFVDKDTPKVNRHHVIIDADTSEFVEYVAVKKGLLIAVEHDIDRVRILSDSEYVAKQLSGDCDFDDGNPIKDEIHEFGENRFESVKFGHRIRDDNYFAVEQAKKAGKRAAKVGRA